MAGSIFQYTHRVVYSECTVGNHIYYARYLDILEAARGEFFRQLGNSLRQLQEADSIFPVIGVEISYKAPARYDDVLTVEIWIAEFGGVRVTFGFQVLNADTTLLVEGQTRHVCTTIDEKPKRLPKDLAERLQPYLRLRQNAL
jgi:acyl-CoA thioester hydrolase